MRSRTLRTRPRDDILTTLSRSTVNRLTQVQAKLPAYLETACRKNVASLNGDRALPMDLGSRSGRLEDRRSPSFAAAACLARTLGGILR